MKNSKKKWIKRIYYNIFPFGLRVYYGLSYQEIKKDLLKAIPKEAHKEIKHLKGKCEGRTYMFSTGQTVIVLHVNDPCTVAHEAFHATEMLLDRLRIYHTRETSEVYAYMIGYIVGEINAKNPDKK
jgi:hypothetical protein